MPCSRLLWRVGDFSGNGVREVLELPCSPGLQLFVGGVGAGVEEVFAAGKPVAEGVGAGVPTSVAWALWRLRIPRNGRRSRAPQGPRRSPARLKLRRDRNYDGVWVKAADRVCALWRAPSLRSRELFLARGGRSVGRCRASWARLAKWAHRNGSSHRFFQVGDPLADQRQALIINQPPGQFGHHDAGLRRFHPVDEDGLVRLTRNNVK